MNLVCLDLEGVLVPEIWIAFSQKTSIPELKLTTRDVPDYDELMRHRLDILEKHHLSLRDIQEVIAEIRPLEGAKPFLDTLREQTQVVILSDTFLEFSRPLMKQLDWPTILCNRLRTNGDGHITGYELRQRNGKKSAVTGFMDMGLFVTAVGDSYNDLSMIETAQRGALFRPPKSIVDEHPTLPVFEDYPPLLNFLLADSGAGR